MDHFDQSITALQETLRGYEEKVAETKKLINALAQAAGRDSVYVDAELQPQGTFDAIQPDTFYGQALNTSIRRVLEMRRAANLGPASVRAIYDALKQGGYEFPRAKSEKSAMDSLRISLGKGSHTFHKLPNGSYGLREWYPGIKDPRVRNGNGGSSSKDQNDGVVVETTPAARQSTEQTTMETTP